MSADPMSTDDAPARPPRVRQPIKDRGMGEPYVAGQYDAVLDRIARPDPSMVRGVEIRVSPSGRSIILAELLGGPSLPSSSPSPAAPPRMISLTEESIAAHFPAYLSIPVDSSRSVEIEIRLLEIPAEDRIDAVIGENWERFAVQPDEVESGNGNGNGKKKTREQKKRRKVQAQTGTPTTRAACLYEYVSDDCGDGDDDSCARAEDPSS